MVPTGTRFGVEKFMKLKTLVMADKGEIFLALQCCLKALRGVRSAKMELLCDGVKFAEDDLGALSVSYSRTSSAGSDWAV